MMENLFFENWTKVYHVALMTVISFIILFLFIRISGKRTLAKFNAFDFIVTVALGSTLTYMMLAKTPLVEGIVVLLLIIGMQFLLARLSRTSDKMEQILNSSPRLLFYKGQYIKESMEQEAITEEEIFAAIRQKGISEINKVLAVVIEPNGKLSVMKKNDGVDEANLLDDVDPQNRNKD